MTLSRIFALVLLNSPRPCDSPAIVAVILAQQLAKALGTDFIIQVPLISRTVLLNPAYTWYRFPMNDVITTRRLLKTI